MLAQIAIGWLATFLTGAVLWAFWEKQDPLREIKYSAEFLKEFGAALISIFFTIILAYAYAYILKLFISPSLIESVGWSKVLSLPLWIRLTIAYLLKDFWYYLFHWWMHNNQYLWLTHQWHHSTKQLWWLAAQRTSLTSRFLFQIGFIVFPLLSIPAEVMFFVGLFGALHENWTHLNAKWRSWMGILEWVFVTPRYHSLHHTQMGGKNMGSYFTIFDRIFGTYVDPESVNPDEQQYGSVDRPITVRTIVGV